jgi:hypothetical protein
MHQIAQKTKQETVSMRIITLVTLFFLPGTFISVRYLLFILFLLLDILIRGCNGTREMPILSPCCRTASPARYPSRMKLDFSSQILFSFPFSQLSSIEPLSSTKHLLLASHFLSTSHFQTPLQPHLDPNSPSQTLFLAPHIPHQSSSLTHPFTH